MTKFAGFVLWVVGAIFYAYQYVLRVIPNVVLDDVMQKFRIDAITVGQFSGVYYIGYALFHIPIGIMMDRFGPKKVMSICILITVVGMSPLLFADHHVYAILGRALLGLGSSAAVLGLFKIIRIAFKDKHFSRMLSFSVTIGLLGAIYGGGPVQYLRNSLGYNAVIEIFMYVGIVLAAITYFVMPNMESTRQYDIIRDLKLVYRNKKVMLCSISAGLMVGPLEGFADVWGATFLKKAYGFGAEESSYMTSLIFMGMCFGAPLISFIAEKLGKYIPVIIGCSVVMIASFIPLLVGEPGKAVIALSFIAIGVASGYQILSLYKASKYVPERIVGMATAFVNMIVMLFGYGFHSSMGFIINTMGGADKHQALLWGVGIIPIALVVASVGFMVLARIDKKG